MTFTDEQARDAFRRHAGAFPQTHIGDLSLGRALLTLEAERDALKAENDDLAAGYGTPVLRRKLADALRERDELAEVVNKNEEQRLRAELDAARRETEALREALAPLVSVEAEFKGPTLAQITKGRAVLASLPEKEEK